MRAYFSTKISKFLNIPDNEILGELLVQHLFSNDIEQKRAWQEQIRILKESLIDFPEADLYFEFSIPRMGKRVDNILILNGIIYLLEFKVFSKSYDLHATEQVLDYALDLKYFHKESHNKTIVPILVATNAQAFNNDIFFDEDNISKVIKTNEIGLKTLIHQINNRYKREPFDVTKWFYSVYNPTPTIIEAARALYANHSVENISRNEAGAINLTTTTKTIEEIIKSSKKNNRKSICFITGVPGAGKTLAGLNIATQSINYDKDEHACFLSGNGPLVKVLREALIRDKVKQENTSRNKAELQVRAFIQNIHHFRDEYAEDLNAPSEKVVIFDEAQRAWNKEQTSKFMNKKSGIQNFEFSEPEFLISVMDRHKDWCTIICLVGGGQEINTGEAGLMEWFITLKEKYQNWDIYCSSAIKEKEYIINTNAQNFLKTMKINQKDELHLNISLRSFRGEKLSEFICSIIDNNPAKAKSIYHELKPHYPIFLTRDLKIAKKWVKDKARGSETTGLLAHSNAIRLKPEGVYVKSELDCVNWFLNDKFDIRSSCSLEDCATEFDVQGLELDWTIVCWDANLRNTDNHWEYLKFVGNKWNNINKEEDKKYLLNSYRVLLTRARQGMIIYIPNGSNDDVTRLPKYYSELYNYLKSCGLEEK